jgi:magnesium transporter
MDTQSSRRNFAPKILINDRELVDHESVDDADIYRGDRPTTPQTQESGSAASLKSISIASSGSSRLPGGRLGALATRLEQAITRWARKNWADSSSSIISSATSDTSRWSFRTTNRSSRRRRPPSIANILHREESERAVAARIKAREISRVVPREFNLYAPPPSLSQDAGPIEEEQRVVRTFALDVMLPHLNPLLRSSGKHRRPRNRSRIPRTELDCHHHHHQRHLHPRQAHSAEDESRDVSHNDTLRGPSLTAEKGKEKIPSTMPLPDALQTSSTSRRDPVAGKPRQAWWLDVASPTWGDMKTLGRVNKMRLILIVKLTRGTVTASSPIDPGGHLTTGITREIGAISKAWLLFHHTSYS